MSLNDILATAQPVLTHVAIGAGAFVTAKATSPRSIGAYTTRVAGIAGLFAGPYLFGSDVANYLYDPHTVGGVVAGLAGAAPIGATIGILTRAAVPSKRTDQFGNPIIRASEMALMEMFEAVCYGGIAGLAAYGALNVLAR